MGNVNTVTMSGNLTRDPELRHTTSGTAVCGLRLASNRSRKNDAGGYDEVPCYVNINVWSNFGELVARKLQQGDAVTVQGRLESREWEQDGQKRYALEIVADQIDSKGMFRTAAEEKAVEGATQAPEFVPAAASDDDIPF